MTRLEFLGQQYEIAVMSNQEQVADLLRVWIDELGPEEIFLKNVLTVEVDGLKGVNRYTAKALYDVKRGDRYELKHKVIEDVILTWDEIEEEGGVIEINKQLRECYNV